MPDDGVALIRLVANTAVVGEGDPAALADLLQPRFVRRVVREMTRVPLDGQAAVLQNLRESLTEVAVGEIDKAQAARS